MMNIKGKPGRYELVSGENYKLTGAQDKSSAGLTPIELLESSLGLCMLIVMNRMLQRDNYENVEVEVSIKGKKAEEGPSHVESLELSVSFSGQELDESYRKKIVKSAEKACTIGNTLRNGTNIRVTDIIGN